MRSLRLLAVALFCLLAVSAAQAAPILDQVLHTPDWLDRVERGSLEHTGR